MLQIISTCIGPHRLAQQTQVLQEGFLTPYDHVFTICQHMDTHRTRRNDDILAGFAEKTEKYSVSVSFFFGLTPPPRPKPTDFLVRNRKTDRAIFYFRFTTRNTGGTQFSFDNLLRSHWLLTAELCSTVEIFYSSTYRYLYQVSIKQ